jgi:hypothetical protein
MFNQDRAMFDSVYGMILAKTLPNVPQGVDRNHPEVQPILTRLRNEAGGLVGTDALIAAQKKIRCHHGPRTRIARANKCLQEPHRRRQYQSH